MPPLSTKNHFVPRIYLKRWTNSAGKLFVYRLLVPHKNVPEWKPATPEGIAFRDHLYIHATADGLSDELERWFATEFESPAELIISKALANEGLGKDDWRVLIRFLACQDVRTPYGLRKSLVLQERIVPAAAQFALDHAAALLQEASDGKPIPQPAPLPSYVNHISARASIEDMPGTDSAALTITASTGRSFWHFGIQHQLTHTVEALLKHDWTILRVPEHIRLHTSDNPVLKLNYRRRQGTYDFEGGWNSDGTEIFMPLGPKHLLFTRVGESKLYENYSILNERQATGIQRLIIEHADRSVFATEPDLRVPTVRSRVVDLNRFQKEEAAWKKFHSMHTEAETSLLQNPNGPPSET